jgi:uncharacterized protein YcfJ
MILQKRGAVMNNKRISVRTTHFAFALVLCLCVTTVGCAIDEGDVPIGTIAGGLGGAAVGSLIGGGATPIACALGGAALGGIAGNQLIDKPSQERSKDRDYQRQLDLERQKLQMKEDMKKKDEDYRLFEQWKKQQGY